jgi:hypothetical protein
MLAKNAAAGPYPARVTTGITFPPLSFAPIYIDCAAQNLTVKCI